MLDNNQDGRRLDIIHGVVAIPCVDGLIGVAITDPKQLDRVQANNPILGSALLTRWSRAWVLWCWTDVPGDQPIPISTGDPGKGVVLVQDELIPVARCEPGASVLEVRQGPIPLVRLADLRWDDASGINSSRTDCEAAELHAPPNGPGVTESETSGAEADPLEELRSHLREVLVGDPRLVASLAGGNNVDADLGPNGPAGRIIAVECGAQGLFHLTAAIIDSQQSLSSFLARNRSTFRG